MEPALNHDDVNKMITAVDKLPEGGISPVQQAAHQVGASLFTMLLYLFSHPDVVATIKADLSAGDYAKAVEDVVAAWQASHP